MHWIFLAVAILAEVAGTTCMKLSQGFTKPGPTAGIVCFYVVCFTLLTLAVKRIDLAVAYAIWAGVGTALITAVGVTFFHEVMSPMKWAGVILVIGGVVLLNLGGGH